MNGAFRILQHPLVVVDPGVSNPAFIHRLVQVGLPLQRFVEIRQRMDGVAARTVCSAAERIGHRQAGVLRVFQNELGAGFDSEFLIGALIAVFRGPRLCIDRKQQRSKTDEAETDRVHHRTGTSADTCMERERTYPRSRDRGLAKNLTWNCALSDQDLGGQDLLSAFAAGCGRTGPSTGGSDFR